jgi:hypothetical protein
MEPNMAVVRITSHTLEAGNSIIQVRNISEVGILRDNSYRSKRRGRWIYGILILAFGFWAFASQASTRSVVVWLQQRALEAGMDFRSVGDLGALLNGFFGVGQQMGGVLQRAFPSVSLAVSALGIALIIWGFAARPVYELLLQTNAGACTMFNSRRLASMQELVGKLRSAMADTTGSYVYQYTDASVSINDSAGVVLTGNNSSVAQTLNQRERVSTS